MISLTNGQVHDAIRAIKQCADRPRVIPQMAKFKLARINDTLERKFTEIELIRQQLVQTHGHMMYADPPTNSIERGWGLQETSPGFAQYIQEWNALRDLPAGEFKITPLTLRMLGDDPKGIEMDEFSMLGGLIVDTDDNEETRG